MLTSIDYSFAKRFGDEKGTNPEELIGAAHAGCFSMQLSGVLGAAGLTAGRDRTTSAVTGAMDDSGFTITAVHLTVKAKVPGAAEAAFRQAAQTAKEICPVSKVLNADDITMDARLAA